MMIEMIIIGVGDMGRALDHVLDHMKEDAEATQTIAIEIYKI